MHFHRSANSPIAPEIEFSDFLKVDIRVGTVVKAEIFPEAKKPALKLWIDFGPVIGIKSSSAQITDYYSPDLLLQKKVLAVVNFKARKVGPFLSEVLTLGVADEQEKIILCSPDQNHFVQNGSLLF